MVLLVEGAALVHSKWAVLLAVPAITFPFAFIADLYYWMRSFGLNLNRDAPLSQSVKPFVPTVLGEGGIGQFKTYAELGTGYWLAVVAAGAIVVGFWFHRRAYRPLVLRFKHTQTAHSKAGVA
jgi:copper chaperone NosL